MTDKRKVRAMLVEEAEKLRRLVDRIHVTYRTPHASPQARAEHEAACAQFYNYASPIWPYVVRAYAERAYSDPNLLEFAVCYVEVAPRFFRSGYHMARILTGLKRTPLCEAHARRLREALLTAVRERGEREFRRYCRLAPVVADFGMVQELTRLATAPDPKPASGRS